jgi:hypothetical protein
LTQSGCDGIHDDEALLLLLLPEPRRKWSSLPCTI